MHLQVLASGSGGNATLVRAGDTHALVDAGLLYRDLAARLADARVQPRRLDWILLTHGHLDHARGAGWTSWKTGCGVLCTERVARNRSLRRARRLAFLTVGRPCEPEGPRGSDGLVVRPVAIPHDAVPTVAFRLEHRGRTAVVLTDMGRPDEHAARALAGAHLLVLEFNHDRDLLAGGPYPFRLKRRIAGERGHLSNDEACAMLRRLAGPELHTLVLAHLSRTNNRPELAVEAARATLEELGLGHVRVLVADQDAIGPNLAV